MVTTVVQSIHVVMAKAATPTEQNIRDWLDSGRQGRRKSVVKRQAVMVDSTVVQMKDMKNESVYASFFSTFT